MARTACKESDSHLDGAGPAAVRGRSKDSTCVAVNGGAGRALDQSSLQAVRPLSSPEFKLGTQLAASHVRQQTLPTHEPGSQRKRRKTGVHVDPNGFQIPLPPPRGTNVKPAGDTVHASDSSSSVPRRPRAPGSPLPSAERSSLGWSSDGADVMAGLKLDSNSGGVEVIDKRPHTSLLHTLAGARGKTDDGGGVAPGQHLGHDTSDSGTSVLGCAASTPDLLGGRKIAKKVRRASAEGAALVSVLPSSQFTGSGSADSAAGILSEGGVNKRASATEAPVKASSPPDSAKKGLSQLSAARSEKHLQQASASGVSPAPAGAPLTAPATITSPSAAPMATVNGLLHRPAAASLSIPHPHLHPLYGTSHPWHEQAWRQQQWLGLAPPPPHALGAVPMYQVWQQHQWLGQQWQAQQQHMYDPTAHALQMPPPAPLPPLSAAMYPCTAQALPMPPPPPPPPPPAALSPRTPGSGQCPSLAKPSLPLPPALQSPPTLRTAQLPAPAQPPPPLPDGEGQPLLPVSTPPATAIPSATEGSQRPSPPAAPPVLPSLPPPPPEPIEYRASLAARVAAVDADADTSDDENWGVTVKRAERPCVQVRLMLDEMVEVSEGDWQQPQLALLELDLLGGSSMEMRRLQLVFASDSKGQGPSLQMRPDPQPWGVSNLAEEGAVLDLTVCGVSVLRDITSADRRSVPLVLGMVPPDQARNLQQG